MMKSYRFVGKVTWYFFLNLIKYFIPIVFVLIFCTCDKEENNSNYVLGEAIVCIPHQYFSLPEGKSEATINEITTTQNLMKVFRKYEVTKIEKVFPFFQPEDTLVVNEIGDTIIITDFSRIYKLIFPPYRSVEKIVEELNQLSEVVYAEPNHIYHFETSLLKKYLTNQWLNSEIECCIFVKLYTHSIT